MEKLNFSGSLKKCPLCGKSFAEENASYCSEKCLREAKIQGTAANDLRVLMEQWRNRKWTKVD